MQKIDFERISNNTNGVPDCWHIDPADKSSPEVFQRHFGLPRSLRNDKKILEAAFVRSKRLAHFMWCLLRYRNLGLPIMLTGDGNISPEAHAMARYDEGWHLRDEEDLIEVAKLEEDDLKTKLTDLLAQRRDKDFKLQQVRVQALANRANTTIDHAYEAMSKCAIETWLRARNDLASWEQLDAATKQQLAEVIFAGFTFFGKAALEDVAAIEPGVFAFYRSFRGLQPLSMHPAPVTSVATEQTKPIDVEVTPVPQEISMALAMGGAAAQDVTENPATTVKPEAHAVTTSPPQGGVQVPAGNRGLAEQSVPQSLQELYALIGGVCQQAAGTPDAGPEPGYRIRELLDQHLQRLVEDLRARLSSNEIRALIECYCDGVLNMANALEFDNSEQRDLVPVLRAAWKNTVVSALEDGRPKAWFEFNLSERQQLPEFVERFEAEQARIAAATLEIEAIRAQLVQAKFTARASLKAKETHNNNEISSALQGLEMIRVEAAHCLVPDGRTLDDLMEDVSPQGEIDIEVEGFNLQAVQDLQSVLSDLKLQDSQAEAQVELSAIQEAEVASVETPPALVAGAVVQEKAVQLEPVEPVVITEPVMSADVVQATHREIGPELEHVAVQDSPVAVQRAPKLAPALTIPEERNDFAKLAVQEVDEALKHLYWAESKEEAQQAFRIAHSQYSQVPRYVVEAVALHWIEAGHLNVAAQILRDANESTLLSDQVLNASLLRSAFYGMNLWPKDREALSFIQRDLNLLNHRDLEDQLERKPTGKLVPYLLVCATLQPALFAGGETQAATLLKMGGDHFDDHLCRLIKHTADFTLRGGRLDLEMLRNEQAQETHLAAANVRDLVNSWVDLNQQRTNRWHALRLALRNCTKHPVLANAIASIKAGEAGDSIAVRLFLNTFSSHTESRRLLDELVAEIRADSTISDHIDSQAYSTFCQQIDGLVSIAQAWLLEVVPSEMRPKEIQDFLQKFHTLLDRSIHNLENHPGHADLEHRAGSAVLLKMLTKLQSEIKKPSHSTWRFDQTDAIFRLPETLARLDMGDVGVDLRLEWFAMRLTSSN